MNYADIKAGVVYGVRRPGEYPYPVVFLDDGAETYGEARGDRGYVVLRPTPSMDSLEGKLAAMRAVDPSAELARFRAGLAPSDAGLEFGVLLLLDEVRGAYEEAITAYYAERAPLRQPIVARTKGELVGRLIGMDISCFDASDLADLDKGDQHTVDLGNHACGGRSLYGPHHDLWIIAVVGGWWLLLPVPGGESCQAVACDGMYAPRPRSADCVPGEKGLSAVARKVTVDTVRQALGLAGSRAGTGTLLRPTSATRRSRGDIGGLGS